MNEETVRQKIRKAENDLKIGKDEMNTENPATDAVCFWCSMRPGGSTAWPIGWSGCLKSSPMRATTTWTSPSPTNGKV